MSERQSYKVLAILSFIVCASVWYFSFGFGLFGVSDGSIKKVKAAAVSWDGGGGDNDWCTDANWSGDAEPTTSDDVTIDTADLKVTTSGCVTEGNDLDFSTLTIGGSASTTLLLTQDIGTGGSITISTSGTLQQDNTNTQTITGTLTVENIGTLRHTNNSTTQSYVIDFVVANLDLQTGGTIDVDELGYDGGPSDAGSSETENGSGPGGGADGGAYGGGGAHAGNGGDGVNENLVIQSAGGAGGYDDPSAPTMLGSGGGAAITNGGGDGGGAVKITITGGGTANIDGTITAKGGPYDRFFDIGRFGGAGAGGSVWLNFSAVGSVSGTGSIDVSGGDGDGSKAHDIWNGGGGGGGHIAVTGHASDSFSGSGSFVYNGGGHTLALDTCCDDGDAGITGGGGTLWLQTNGNLAELHLGAVFGVDNKTPTLVTSTVTIGNLHMSTGSYLQIESAGALDLSGVTTTIGMDGVTNTAYVDVRGTLTVSSTFTVPATSHFITGPTNWSGLTDLLIAPSATFELENNTTSSAWTSLDSLTVNGTLTHKDNSSTVHHAINIQADTITINSSGLVNGSQRGYSGGPADTDGSGPGGGEFGSNDGGGAGYGGAGGAGESSGANAGSAYGSTSTASENFGSGGGGQEHTAGGDGGGSIHLVANGTLTLEGQINVDGGTGGNSCGGIPASGAGGGSGGGVHLEADTFTGSSGSISADGGNGGGNGLSCGGGGGGGGRILITVDTNSFAGSMTASSGATGGPSGSGENGSDGTVKTSPSKPTALFSNSSDASSGDTNPLNLTSTTPVFSAIYNGTENANKARIQVSTSSEFTTTFWDAGVSGGAITAVADSSRSGDIIYGNIGDAATTNLSLDDDTNESSSTTYYWRIQFIDIDDVASPWSASSTFTLIDIPDNATSLATSSVASTSTVLTWSDNSSVEDNYLVTYSTDGVTFSNTSTEAANETTSTITGLTPNTDYTLSVRGTNAAGNSDHATTTLLTLANVPSALLKSTGDQISLTMSWTANSNPAGTEYCIVLEGESCTDSDWQTTQSKTFEGLSDGTTYSYQVKARNAANTETAFTAAVEATTDSAGGAGGDGGGGGGCACPLPEPLPFPEDEEPPEEEPLQPSGLIQIVESSDIDVLELGGKPADFEVDGYGDINFVESSEPALNLDKPFGLEIKFTPLTHPLWRTGSKNHILSKAGAYRAGYGSSSSDIALNGFCFDILNPFMRVCDKTNPIPFKVKHYVVRWDGTTLSLRNGDETKSYSTASVSDIGTSNSQLVIGGTRTEYKPGKFSNSFFPLIFHALKIKQEQPVQYINSKDVVLKIDATYANLLWLLESNDAPTEDFTTAQLDDIVAEKDWDLSGQDGKKCVNAKFLNQPPPGESGSTYEYVTYACVILDTTKPTSNFSVSSGIKDGKIVNKPKVFGTSEPNATVTITVEEKDAEASSWLRSLDESIRTGIVVGYLAGEKSSYTVTADESGNWEFEFPSYLAEGSYVITTKASDKAGNVSNVTTKSLSITLPAPTEPEELPPEEPPEELPPEELPPEEPPEELPPEELPPEEPPVDPPIDPVVPSENPTTESDTSDSSSGDTSSTVESTVDTEEIEIIEEQPETRTENVVDVVKNVLGTTLGTIKNVIDNPVVEQVNEKVAVPIVLATGVANVAAGAQIPNVLVFLRYLFGQPLMMFRRRKKKTWGVVYNGFTKAPIDLATVRVIDEATGRVVRTQVTDGHGRYFLFVTKGTYRIEIIKPGIVGFSEHLMNTDEDAKYSHLYHGGAFEVVTEQRALTFNIPVDPDAGGDKPVHKILRDHVVKAVQYGMSMVGMIASIVSFIISPSPTIGALIVVHVLFYFVFHKFSHKKLPDTWGVVTSLKGGEKLSKVVVRVFDSAYNKLINTSVTDRKGRYAVLVGPSVYYVTYEKAGFAPKKSENLDYSEGETDGVGGLIARDESLKAGSAAHVKKDVDDAQIEEGVDENYMSDGRAAWEEAPEGDEQAAKDREAYIQKMKDKAAGVD